MWETEDVKIAGFSFLIGMLILTKDASWPEIQLIILSPLK